MREIEEFPRHAQPEIYYMLAGHGVMLAGQPPYLPIPTLGLNLLSSQGFLCIMGRFAPCLGAPPVPNAVLDQIPIVALNSDANDYDPVADEAFFNVRGATFTFDDTVHGWHLDHARPDLETPEGQAGIQRNGQLMLSKHGITHPWQTLARLEQRGDGTLTWLHV